MRDAHESEATIAPPLNEAVAWHDVECGVYAADLPVWSELADRAAGPVLELGCGTGRVALHLARAGHEVVGLDRDPELLAALQERAGAERLGLTTLGAEVSRFTAGRRFGLVVAPMQLVQLLDRPARRAMLATAARHLNPGGTAAFALAELPAEPWQPSRDSPPPAPDVREHDGWIFSSLPIAIDPDRDGVTIRRLRQLVSPSGELRESQDAVRLAALAPEALEHELREAGLVTVGRREIAETADHLGSTVLVAEAPR